MYDLDSFIVKSSDYPVHLPLKEAEVYYFPHFIPKYKANDYFEILNKETAWRQDSITLFGKTYPQPRLTALYGNNGKAYSYSGITMNPQPFTIIHLELLAQIKKISEENFTTVLLNLYRNGQDSNGWHSDNEKELGLNPVIASVSFGEERFFQFKHRVQKNERYKFTLGHGSLLLMQGPTQHYWLHQLPKSQKVQKPRINLTFRRID